jgi:hypothetical protein
MSRRCQPDGVRVHRGSFQVHERKEDEAMYIGGGVLTLIIIILLIIWLF